VERGEEEDVVLENCRDLRVRVTNGVWKKG